MLTLAASAASAALVRVDASGFAAWASPGKITFQGLTLGADNPSIAPANYGGDASAGAPTVSFGSFFNGQSLGTGCGGPDEACVTGDPTGAALTLTTSPGTKVVSDLDVGWSDDRQLSGIDGFVRPIAMLLDADVFGIAFDVGFLNITGLVPAPGLLRAKAYAADGGLLGQFDSTVGGIESFYLRTDDATKIRGVLVYLVGNDSTGFSLDNVQFSVARSTTPPPSVPEPGTLALLGTALAGLGLMRRRAR